MAGILIWTMVFFGLLIGGALGANEKEGGTEVYIQMASKGKIASLIGKGPHQSLSPGSCWL
jgi:hypothetical protein